MQIKDVEYFMAIVEAGSFSAAADKLFISQPALSQHVKKIENELGIQLFDRSKRSVVLTEAGKIFRQEGRQLLQVHSRLLGRISMLGFSEKETVRFGISPFYSRHYLPELLPALIKAYPMLKYEVTENYSYMIEKALLEKELDFVLVPLLPKNPLLVYEPVYQESILLAVPKDSYINEFAIPSNTGLPYMELQRLQDASFISLKSVQKFTEFTNRIFEQTEFTPNIVCETMNWDALNTLVSTGLGVGFVPDLLIKQLDENVRPKYYRLLPEASRMYAIAYRRSDGLSGTAKCVVEVFKEAFRNRTVAEYIR